MSRDFGANDPICFMVQDELKIRTSADDHDVGIAFYLESSGPNDFPCLIFVDDDDPTKREVKVDGNHFTAKFDCGCQIRSLRGYDFNNGGSGIIVKVEKATDSKCRPLNFVSMTRRPAVRGVEVLTMLVFHSDRLEAFRRAQRMGTVFGVVDGKFSGRTLGSWASSGHHVRFE